MWETVFHVQQGVRADFSGAPFRLRPPPPRYISGAARVRWKSAFTCATAGQKMYFSACAGRPNGRTAVCEHSRPALAPSRLFWYTMSKNVDGRGFVCRKPI